MSPSSQNAIPVKPHPPSASERAATLPLTPGASLLLDLVRLAAALTVAWGHLTLPGFSTGLTDRMQAAGAAVIVFYVLSGFVIRYVTRRTPGTLRSYLTDRASRIYSVLLPAVILTVGVALSLGYLDVSTPAQARGVALRVMQILLFTSWSWHQQVILPANGALWSISFECLFYLLYGVCFYLRGWARILGLLLAALWAGPEVLTFFPVWLAGCLLYDLYNALRSIAPLRLAKAMALAALALACAALVLRHRLASIHGWVAARYHLLQSENSPVHSSMLWPRIGHGAPISLNAYPEAALYFAAFLALLLLADHLPVAARGGLRILGSKLADATFPLYLLHLPLFCIAVRLLGRPIAFVGGDVALIALVLAVSVLSAPPLNHLKTLMRHRGQRTAASGAESSNASQPLLGRNWTQA